MTKIIGFKNRLLGLLVGAYGVITALLYSILIILVVVAKFILGCLGIVSFGLWSILGVIISPALFILGAGLIPLEIILFLIIGETKAFTILYKIGMKYWDINVYPGKASLDLFNLIEKPWVI
jgi:hypothetical protein